MYRRARSQVLAAKVGAGKTAPWPYYLANTNSEVEARTMKALDEVES